MNNNGVPDFQSIFGDLDFKKGDDSRSVYSPAAYLADLLQVLEDYFRFEDGVLAGRREDIATALPLNKENTYDPVPYLDIVNRLLEASVLEQHRGAGTAYEVLKEQKYPFNLPFNLENERYKKLLGFAGVAPEHLYKLFFDKYAPSAMTTALEYLGISEETYLGLTPRSFASPARIVRYIEEHYGLPGDLDSLSAGDAIEDLRLGAFIENVDGFFRITGKEARQVALLSNVENFLAAVGLNRMELLELVRENLSTTSLDHGDGPLPETTLADQLFINWAADGGERLPGYASLDAREENLVWRDGDEESAMPLLWFVHASKFLRLAKAVRLPFSQLGLFLRSCGSSDWNYRNIVRLAPVLQFYRQYELPFEEACALFAGVNTLGMGDEEEPADLFNRTFNGRYALLEKAYIPAGDLKPAAYAGFTPLTCDGDILQEHNRPFRKRLARALHLSEKDVATIVEKYREHFPDTPHLFAPEAGFGPESLSLFFRIVKLCELMEVSFSELFALLPLIDADPTIRRYEQFATLIGAGGGFFAEEDSYRILEGFGDLPFAWKQDEPDKARFRDAAQAGLFWLAPLLAALGKWMQASDFTVAELKAILTGSLDSEQANEEARERKIAFLNELYNQFSQVALQEHFFTTDRFDIRSSRVIHRTLLGRPELVSAKDERILSYEEEAATDTAFAALQNMELFHPDDFLGLGLEDKMVDKIYNNLAIKGYIDANGQLVEEAFPDNPEDFHINFTSGDSQIVFELIHRIYNNGNGEAGSSSEQFGEIQADLALFLSDFDALPLDEKQKAELYDNLMFNNYIDEEGNVLDPLFFADPQNKEFFEADANIDEYSDFIYELIAEQIGHYGRQSPKLDPEIFAALPLKDIEKKDLIQNLIVNDYIDEGRHYLNKDELLKLDIKDFNISLQFYPHRRQVLAAMQGQLAEFKKGFYIVSKEMLAEPAGQIVADIIYLRLEEEVLADGKMNEAGRAFFADPANVVDFGITPYFTPIQEQTVFNAIARILGEAGQYRVQPQDFAELGFNAEEIDEVMGQLARDGFVENGAIPREKLPFFLDINNAILFYAEEFGDFHKDIFFVLNAHALAIDEGIREITARIKEIADAQQEVLYYSLQEYLELPADQARVVCRHVFRQPDNMVEAFMIPILLTVNEDEQITTEPDHNRFNFALKRMRQFALLASKLGLGEKEVDVVFQEQELAEKFPEMLAMPEGVARFEGLLEDTIDGKETEAIETEEAVDVIYMFVKDKYYIYDADTYNLLSEALPLTELSANFKDITEIDAAFRNPQGHAWIIAGADYFCKKADSDEWKREEREWGRVDNNFDGPERVEAAFVDQDGRTYLFSGDQYTRYSSEDYGEPADEGYPKLIKGNWANELPFEDSGLPIDAAFHGNDDITYLFREGTFTSSDEPGVEKKISDFWGKVENNFADASEIKAVVHGGARKTTRFFNGNQQLDYFDSIENPGVMGYEGALKKRPIEPDELEDELDAAFIGADGLEYAFRDNFYLGRTMGEEGAEEASRRSGEVAKDWGRVRNNLLDTGRVDAGFDGVDGRVYLFSGDQYYRYTGPDYSKVDEGYPRRIASDWGGLYSVESALVLDNKTYLFHRREDGSFAYLRYSDNDYSEPDEGYPKYADDSWWNFPEELTKSDFFVPTEGNGPFIPDAAFIDKGQKNYLFKNGWFVVHEENTNWWSEPQRLEEEWDSIPFDRVAAAFRGKDGKVYIFEAPVETEGETEVETEGDKPEFRFIRYSDNQFEKVDDRYPKPAGRYWGKVANNIERRRKIDAGFTLRWTNPETEEESLYTYIFSGDQFFRYTFHGTVWGPHNTYDWVDEGYPRRIKTSLAEEPPFEHLSMKFKQIDAIFADKGNIYLFDGAHCHILSPEIYRKYYQLVGWPMGTIYLEEGTFYAENTEWAENGAQPNPAANWMRIGNLEGLNGPAEERIFPPTLRELPEAYRAFAHRTDAVLQGVDGSAYLFKGSECYNATLEKKYPLAEEWGRERNNIQTDNRIDAAFRGRDNRIYLFRGDQFLCYEALDEDSPLPDFTGGSPILADGLPKSISEHWRGLRNVHIAFVNDDKTYLLEKPDENGRFRCLCHYGEDYSEQSNCDVYEADLSWWNIPEAFIREGFDRVDAVLIEDEHTFLIRGRTFIQYNSEEDLWTYERPLELIWRDIPFNEHEFSQVATLLSGEDGTVYFFSDEAFVRYDGNQFTRPEEIKLRWGLIDNNIVQHQKVDAAFVYDNRETFLFSGSQYVKYTGSDYRFIDEGYPKLIEESLRDEEAFKGLPQEFTEEIKKENSADRRIDAIVANEGNIYLFAGGNCHVVSRSRNRHYDIARIGRLKNNIATHNKVDAAVVDSNGNTYLYSNDQVFAYEGDSAYDFVAEGWPIPISRVSELDPAPDGTPQFIPAEFQYSLDAILVDTDGEVYLFKGKNFIVESDPLQAMPIRLVWGQTHNPFRPLREDRTPVEGNVALDAAFVAPDGSFYLFKGAHYARYAQFGDEFLEEGYPRLIENNWGDLPNAFEEGIEGAFVFEGKTYFRKTLDATIEQYVRFSDPQYRVMDSIYPQLFEHRWGGWNDFLLNDIRIIAQFNRLNREYQGGEHSLAGFFYKGDGYHKDPYAMLAGIFEWNIDELKWLKRKNAFLRPESQFEVHFGLEQVLNIADIFRLANKIGAGPSEVYKQVWLPRFKNEANGAMQPSGALYQFLGSSHSGQDWETITEQFHGEMNVIRRDALMPYVIYRMPGIQSPRELSNHLLIDVEMGQEAVTSNIKEAISAIQLFMHRYFFNLEEGPLSEASRRDLKYWWKWMKNYRVWEANRKVFLYPENYIRPELRDTKTPEFIALEEELLQAEIGDASVEKAYKSYLNFYTEVSRLRIIGGYSFFLKDSPTLKQLVFFGKTRSEPENYYYRTASFEGGDTTKALWNPWLKVDAKIEADRVYPVYAFGRMFVFWMKHEVISENTDDAVVEVASSDDKSLQTAKSKNPDQYHTIKIFFSYYNANKEWVPVQQLRIEQAKDVGAELTLKHKGLISGLKLYVENSDILGNFTYEHIAIKCSYQVTYTVLDESRVLFLNHKVELEGGKIDGSVIGWPNDFTVSKGVARASEPFPIAFPVFPVYKEEVKQYDRAFHLKPNLLAEQEERDTRFPTFNKDSLLGIFHDEEKEPGLIIQLNTLGKSTDGPWFSFDHKGGSFLAKPSVGSLNSNHDLRAISQGAGILPVEWNKIDAAFQGPDGNNYFFQNRDTTNGAPRSRGMALNPPLAGALAPKPDGFFWGRPKGKLGRVTAAFHDRAKNITFLFGDSDQGFFTYSGGEYRYTDRIGARPTNLALIQQVQPNEDVPEDPDFLDRVAEGFESFKDGFLSFFGAGRNTPDNPFENWTQLDAILQDGANTFFFRGRQFVRANGGNLSGPFNISQAWALAKENAFTADDAEVIGAFVHRRRTYLLTDTEIIRYPAFLASQSVLDRKYEKIDSGYPKPNLLSTLLADLGLSLPQGVSSIANEKIVGAHNEFSLTGQTLRILRGREAEDDNLVKGNILIRTDGGAAGQGRAFLVTLANNRSNGQIALAADRAGEAFELELDNDPATERLRSKTPAVRTALWGEDGSVYLFRGSEFIKLDGATMFRNRGILSGDVRADEIDTIFSRNHPAVNAQWRTQTNFFNDTLSATYTEGGKVFFFSGNRYLRMSGAKDSNGVYQSIDSGYPRPLPTNAADNPDNLPLNWTQVDAVFRAQDGKVFFFGGEQYAVRTGATVAANATIQDRWAVVPNKVMLDGVDTAYLDGSHLYLIREREYVRYSKPAGTGTHWAIPDRIDDGYPKKLNTTRAITAGFVLNGRNYLFAGPRYAGMAPGTDPGSLTNSSFKSINGNWGNIHQDMKAGIDAAISMAVPEGGATEERLYFFKDNVYVRYGGYDNEGEDPVMPYELGNVSYDIIRLTTSTGYKLNTILFEGGMPALLRKQTQEIDETPAFTFGAPKPEVVALKEARVKQFPNSTYLDFDSANGIYYWELFFHAPFLVAQSLNTSQNFEDAKTWYEYIFDPTESQDYWKFLPFLSVDVAAMQAAYHGYLERLGLSAAGEDSLRAVDEALALALPLFNGEKELAELSEGQKEQFAELPTLAETARETIEDANSDAQARQALDELLGVIGRLPVQHRLMHPVETQLNTFRNDPFDPHAIAALRRIAYKKAIVMAYIDNILDWGDMLFQQYTAESINEARMLYVLAYDLLGPKPENAGKVPLEDDKTYAELFSFDDIESVDLDLLLQIENSMEDPSVPSTDSFGPVNVLAAEREGPVTELSSQGPVRILDSIMNFYFFIPENEQFIDYWTRVEDRLFKIRQSLNILGEKQPLPLFQPPIDPMAIVSAVGSGAALSQAIAAGQVSVPHYRFDFMMTKARELVQKLDQFGGELLAALEKKDTEKLTLMQTEFEGVILEKTRKIKEAQIEEAESSIRSLQHSKTNAQKRIEHYTRLVNKGMLELEKAQVGLMITGGSMHVIAAIFRQISAGLASAPDVTLGPFSLGVTSGGNGWSNAFGAMGDVVQGLGESLSMIGEAMGIFAQYERMAEDWAVQLDMATADKQQIEEQIIGAQVQKQIAQYDLDMLEKQIEQNEQVSSFMKSKFTNQQLYQWMAGKLSGLYYQTYKMAYDIAKGAEKAYQFERAMLARDVNFIQPVYWNSQRKGLLAGAMLGHDLDRMEKQYLETYFWLQEVSKRVSLLELDPLAFLKLRNEGVCEFSLTEAFFDYDFPGHYCRQIKTVYIDFDMGEGVYVNATLTQLTNKVIVEPDPKAVKYLLDPKGQPPLTLRSEWRANQQRALSFFEDYEKNNGLFELRFDTERYLPFEGTGAVSTWRLELNGKKSDYNFKDLVDVMLTIKYTSIPGGEAFTDAVRGMLKPYSTVKYIDLNYDFHDQWLAFLDSDQDTLELAFERSLFPGMASGKITTLYTEYDLFEEGKVSITLNNKLELKDREFADPSGLNISSNGSLFSFRFEGDKALLRTVNFVMGYKAKV